MTDNTTPSKLTFNASEIMTLQFALTRAITILRREQNKALADKRAALNKILQEDLDRLVTLHSKLTQNILPF